MLFELMQVCQIRLSRLLNWHVGIDKKATFVEADSLIDTTVYEDIWARSTKRNRFLEEGL